MNVAFIGAFTGVGGIQRTTAIVASSLAKAHRIFYIDYRSDGAFRYPLDDDIHIYEVATLANKGSLMSLKDKLHQKYTTEITQIIKILESCYIDIAIFCGSFCTAMISLIKKQNNNIKIVAWQRNTYEQYVGRFIEKYREEYFAGISLADTIVCLTNFDIQGFSSLNPNTICINNPLGITHNKKFKENEKRFIFVGRAAIEQKGLDLLIKSFEDINNVEWSLSIIVDRLDKPLEEMVRNARKTSNITLKYDSNDEELIENYCSGSVFIMTSRWEGFGMTLVEAMSFGLPIIATPTVGAKEVLLDGKYGLITRSFSIEDITDAMRKFIENKEIRNHYSQQSLIRVKDMMPSKIILHWEKLFNDIVKWS